MKRYFSFYIIAIFIFGAASVVAVGAASKGCNPQGSWVSFDPLGPSWTAVVQGQSASSGTNELEYPFLLPKFPVVFPGQPGYPGYLFPDAVGMTPLRGAWERTGGNTFDYTMVGHGYGENGIPMWAGKVIGDITLHEDCNSGDFAAIVEVFVCPACNPFTDEPFTVITWPTTTGYRVVVE